MAGDTASNSVVGGGGLGTVSEWTGSSISTSSVKRWSRQRERKGLGLEEGCSKQMLSILLTGSQHREARR